MAPRLSPKTSATGETPNLQIKDLAFNIFGWAMRDDMASRHVPQRIVARAASAVQYRAAIKAMNASDQRYQRESMELNGRESGAAAQGLQEYIIVGYVRDETLDAKYFIDAHSRPVGHARPDQSDILPFRSGSDGLNCPLFAVIEVTPEPPVAVRLHVLLYDANGLCKPFIVPQRDVFYRHEFRNAARPMIARASSWNRMILEHSVGVKYRMLGFVDPDKRQFGDVESNELLEEVKSTWPDLEHLSQVRLQCLKKGLGECGLRLKHRWVRAFIAEGCYRLYRSNDSLTIEQLGNLAEDVNEMLERTQPL